MRNPNISCSILDSVGAKCPMTERFSITESLNAKMELGINHKDKGVTSAALIRNEA